MVANPTSSSTPTGAGIGGFLSLDRPARSRETSTHRHDVRGFRLHSRTPLAVACPGFVGLSVFPLSPILGFRRVLWVICHRNRFHVEEHADRIRRARTPLSRNGRGGFV